MIIHYPWNEYPYVKSVSKVLRPLSDIGRIFGDFTEYSVIFPNIRQIYKLAHILLSRESMSVHIYSNFAEYSVKLPNIQ